MVNWLREWLRGPIGHPGPVGPQGPPGKDLIHKIGYANPVDIEGATEVLGPPANWDTEKYGECSWLSVIKADGRYVSEWELPNGQKVRVHITGNFHPPIAIEAV